MLINSTLCLSSQVAFQLTVSFLEFSGEGYTRSMSDFILYYLFLWYMNVNIKKSHLKIFLILVTTTETSEFRCDVRMRIDSGWVCGLIRVAEHSVRYASFRGIPYAKQPLRELRFKVW